MRSKERKKRKKRMYVLHPNSSQVQSNSSRLGYRKICNSFLAFSLVVFFMGWDKQDFGGIDGSLKCKGGVRLHNKDEKLKDRKRGTLPPRSTTYYRFKGPH